MKYPKDGETVLIIDPSSDSIGWSIAKLSKDQFVITNSGALRATSSWSLGRRLFYMYRSIKLLCNHFKVTTIVSEEAIIARGMAGAAVVPTIVNIIKMLAYELLELDLVLLHVDSWRKQLGISGIPKVDKRGQLVLNKRGKPKKDFKEPCAQKVKEILKIDLPELILDNRNLRQSALKDDVSDSLGIAIAYGMSLNYPIIKASADIFTNSDTINVVKAIFILK